MQRSVLDHTPDSSRLTLDDQACPEGGRQARDALRAAYTAILSWPKRKNADAVSHPDREQESVRRTYGAEITEMVS